MTIYLGWLRDWYERHGYESAKRVYAGVILHEFLHQMGHGHSNGYEDGNVTTVAGDCIASGGDPGQVRSPRASSFNLTGGSRIPLPVYD